MWRHFRWLRDKLVYILTNGPQTAGPEWLSPSPVALHLPLAFNPVNAHCPLSLLPQIPYLFRFMKSKTHTCFCLYLLSFDFLALLFSHFSICLIKIFPLKEKVEGYGGVCSFNASPASWSQSLFDHSLGFHILLIFLSFFLKPACPLGEE